MASHVRRSIAETSPKNITSVGALSILALVGSTLGGCALEAPDEPQGQTSDELVLRSTFNKAHDIVANIDYLPFDYTLDGCYARALYMSMELVANGTTRSIRSCVPFRALATACRTGPGFPS